MSISCIFVYQFRPTILSELNRTISSSDENSIRRLFTPDKPDLSNIFELIFTGFNMVKSNPQNTS